MIRVVYRRDGPSLTVRGHAGSGEPGHDLVCAAASVLAHTLAANARALEAHGEAAATAELRAGEATICCRPAEERRTEVRLLFDAVCLGFALLARDYPEFLSYEVR